MQAVDGTSTACMLLCSVFKMHLLILKSTCTYSTVLYLACTYSALLWAGVNNSTLQLLQAVLSSAQNATTPRALSLLHIVVSFFRCLPAFWNWCHISSSSLRCWATGLQRLGSFWSCVRQQKLAHLDVLKGWLGWPRWLPPPWKFAGGQERSFKIYQMLSLPGQKYVAERQM